MTLLEIKELVKKYKDQLVLNGVNLSFPQTGLVTICGESGCGKSTLLKCILGIIKFDEGKILYRNKEIKNFDEFRNLHTGYVFQNYSLVSFLSPRENIALGIKKENTSIDEVAKKVNIYEKISQNVNTLSGGEKQRVAIARALIGNPEILLCDEPTGSLDYDNAIGIMNLLKQISKDRLVIVVTHNKEHVAAFADMKVNIINGHVEASIVNKNEGSASGASKKHYLKLVSILKMSYSIFKNNFKKIIFSIISLSLSLTFLLLSISTYAYVKNSIEENSHAFLNYNFMKITLNKQTTLENSSFNLVRTILPQEEDLSYISDVLVDTSLQYDLTPVIDTYPNVYLNSSKSKYVDEIEFKPFFISMQDEVSSFISGEKVSSMNEVIVNKKAYELISQDYFYLDLSKSIDYLTSSKEVITDSYHIEMKFNIVGIIDEFSIVDSPYVYYPFDYLENFTYSISLDNLSAYKNKKITLYDRLTKYTYSNDSFASKYYVLEVKNVNDVKRIYDTIDGIKYDECYFDIEADSLNLVNSFSSVFDSIYEVITIFISITIIISILLLGMSLDSLVNDYKIDIGILMCIGILKGDIKTIFILISQFIGIASYLFSLPFYKIGGIILNNYFLNGIPLVQVPSFISGQGIFGFLAIVILLSFLSVLVSLFRINRLQIGEIMREE